MEKSQATPSTIYIRLLEEAAVTCIRPTQAELLEDGTYFVLATPEYDPTDEVWEFVPGSRVHCALFDDGPNGAYLLAIAEAGVEGRKKGRSKIAVLLGSIEYRDATGHLLWHIKVENIVLVAEYTTNEGPFGDDWFLVFGFTIPTPFFFTCTLYSEGMEAVLEFLTTRFAFAPRLTNSTEWKSIVLWPKPIEGAPLIEFSKRPGNWRERLRTWYDGPIEQSLLSTTVRDYLQNLPKKRNSLRRSPITSILRWK
jgi:hypothetical protein